MKHWENPQGATKPAVAKFAVPANLDTVRGLACFMLVAYHVVGSDPGRGLRLPAESDWHYVMASFSWIRMPIFTILSGFLYGRHRVRADRLGEFLMKKLQRIAVALIALTLVTVAIRHFIFAESANPLEPLTHSYEHFWFLQALLIIFLIVALLDCLAMPGRRTLILITLGTAILSANLHLGQTFSVGGALYLLPFFLAGLVLSQWPSLIARRDIAIAAFVTVLVTTILQQLSLHGRLPEMAPSSLAGFACGTATCLFLLHIAPRWTAAEHVGKYSYSIYLWHVLFLAATRMALWEMEVQNIAAVFVGSLMAGIIGPIILHVIVAQIPIASMLLLGLKPRARQQRLTQSMVRSD